MITLTVLLNFEGTYFEYLTATLTAGLLDSIYIAPLFF